MTIKQVEKTIPLRTPTGETSPWVVEDAGRRSTDGYKFDVHLSDNPDMAAGLAEMPPLHGAVLFRESPHKVEINYYLYDSSDERNKSVIHHQGSLREETPLSDQRRVEVAQETAEFMLRLTAYKREVKQ